MLRSPGAFSRWPPYGFAPHLLESLIGSSIDLINEHFPSVSSLGCAQALAGSGGQGDRKTLPSTNGWLVQWPAHLSFLGGLPTPHPKVAPRWQSGKMGVLTDVEAMLRKKAWVSVPALWVWPWQVP